MEIPEHRPCPTWEGKMQQSKEVRPAKDSSSETPVPPCYRHLIVDRILIMKESIFFLGNV